MKRRFLITGHGRSGTHYMAELFQWLGNDVGEQKQFAHGMSHNMPPGLWPFSDARKDYRHLIQVVRNPRLVVESTFLAKYSIPEQTAMRIPEIANGSNMERAIRSVVLWNKAISAAKPDLVVKVEEAPDACADWLRSMDYEISETKDPPPPTDVNKRHHDGWNLDGKIEWDKVSPEVMEMLRGHCIKYNYKGVMP